MVVNKKIRRLMREHDLQPKGRRRFVATTDSDHDNPIFPDLARDRVEPALGGGYHLYRDRNGVRLGRCPLGRARTEGRTDLRDVTDVNGVG